MPLQTFIVTHPTLPLSLQLQSIATAGVVLGVLGVSFSIFAACRVFVITAVAPGDALLWGA